MAELSEPDIWVLSSQDDGDAALERLGCRVGNLVVAEQPPDHESLIHRGADHVAWAEVVGAGPMTRVAVAATGGGGRGLWRTRVGRTFGRRLRLATPLAGADDSGA